MHHPYRVTLLFIGLSAVSGCRQIENAYNEMTNGSTVHGLEQCVAINESQVVSKEATIMRCVERLDSPLPSEQITAFARVDGTAPFEVFLRVENNSTRYLLTRATALFEFFREDVKVGSVEKTIFISAEPTEENGERITFDDYEVSYLSGSSAPFCPKTGRKENCFVWYFEGHGVSVD